MILAGIALMLGGAAIGMGPIAFVCGVLLLWSGIVKVIVLRIWNATLRFNSSSREVDVDDGSKTRFENSL